MLRHQTFFKIVVFLLLMVVHRAVCAAAPYEWDPEKLLSPNEELTCTLEVADKRAVIGKRCTASAVLKAKDAIQIYNPFFDIRLPFRPVMAVFDEDHSYCGNLFQHDVLGKDIRFSPRDWLNVRERDLAGSERIDVPFVRGKANGRIERGPPALPPGKYFLQLIFSSKVVSMRPGGDLGFTGRYDEWQPFLAKWAEQQSTEDYFRSNVVEIELVEGPE